MGLSQGALLGDDVRLVGPLQEGAMGSVWIAEHRALGKRVAVKLVARELLADPTARARFERETRLAAELRSMHVPESYGRGESEDGTPYLVMELLDGETLAVRLERAGRLERGEVCDVLLQVADALDEAHGLGIVHRDIKPANIFLTRGKRTPVKVLDFGMAKRIEALDPSVVTEAGRSVGTPDYMSPEQLRDGKDVDHRADLWALAVVAHRCLTGRLAFVSGTFAGLCMAICTGRYTPPSHLDPELPRALDAWCARALNLDRDMRFATATETIQELRRALTSRRRAWLAAAAVVAVLALVLAAVLAVL